MAGKWRAEMALLEEESTRFADGLDVGDEQEHEAKTPPGFGM